MKSAPRFLVVNKPFGEYVGSPGVDFGALSLNREHAERIETRNDAEACARALNYVDAREKSHWTVEVA